MSKLLMDEPPLQVLPTLARIIGLNEAIVLQQIHFRSRTKNPGRDGRRWVYDSYEQWQAECFPFWSRDTVKRAFRSLENQGLLYVGCFNAKRSDRTKWYALNFERLASLHPPSGQNAPSIGAESSPPSGQNAPLLDIPRIPLDSYPKEPKAPAALTYEDLEREYGPSQEWSTPTGDFIPQRYGWAS